MQLFGKKPEPPPPPRAVEQRQNDGVIAFAQSQKSSAPPPATLCEAAKGNSHDAIEKVDPKRVTLFVSAFEGVSSPIEVFDIRQGQMDDCYILSAMAALANTPSGQKLLRSMIKETLDGYEVRFPGAVGQTVTVSKTEFAKDGARLGSEGPKSEIWVKVIESACARVLGGFTALGNCGTLEKGLSFFCKKGESSPSVDPVKIEAALKNNQPVTINTRTLREMGAQPLVSSAGEAVPLPVEHMMVSWGSIARKARSSSTTHKRETWSAFR